MKSVMICAFRQKLSGTSDQGDRWLGHVTHRLCEMLTVFWWEISAEGRRPLGRIILKCILKRRMGCESVHRGPRSCLHCELLDSFAASE
jgi:hypothetical protein